jgi:hypothetical protein
MGHSEIHFTVIIDSRSQWPRGLGVSLRPFASRDCGFESHREHGCLECCVLSGRGLCDGLITRPEDSYRLWCVVVRDLENLMNEEALAHWGAVAPKTSIQAGINTFHSKLFL